MNKTTFSNGFEISVSKAYNTPTIIRIHKLGTNESSWLTPSELQSFIDELVAVLAESKGGGDA